MLAARSVAVVGASGRPGSFGERLAIEALRSPGLRRVDLVNPAYDAVLGHACAPALDALDQAPDLVLLGVPDPVVPEQLALAGAVGAGAAVVFGSAPGRGDAIRAAAGDLAVCGAGCMGFVNPAEGLRALGYLEREELTPGGIALVTHSGSVFSALLRTHRRLEYSLAVSSGQELVTTTADYLAWALEQPGTTVVGLFLEAMRDGPGLRAALARAAESEVPVVALTVGGSPTGRAMVTAHSGAVAGDDAAWEALFATYGVHRVRDVAELVDTLELFAVGRRVTRRRGGIATVHDSGAERVLVADVASEEDVPFAALGEATRATLAGLLDHGLSVANPLDVWGRGADTEGLFTACLGAVAADDAVDCVALAIDLVEEYDGDESYPRAVLRAHAATDKPVVVLSSVAAAVDQAQAGPLRAAGVPVLEGARSGLRALRHLRAQTERPLLPAPPAFDRHRAARWLPRLGPGAWLDAATSLRLLADYGVVVAPTTLVSSTAEAVAAAETLGYPVVLKTDEADVPHRVAAGGVHLDLADGGQVATAYADLAGRLGPRAVVQPRLPASDELALGLVHDGVLGPLVLVAFGGTQIEAMARRAVGLPPTDRAGAGRLLDRLAAAGPGLPAYGRTEALLDAVVGLGHLAHELGDRLAALDVNPLLLTRTGPVAVDALVEVAP
jgi:acyl-CoA synthetase (NDP forming)